MTTFDDELLAQIRANPRDDHPRRVYADMLLSRGDERGEYMHLALESSWDDAKKARWAELQRRETHWAADLGLGGIQFLHWVRGLPDSLTGSFELVLRHGDAINRLPITGMTLRDSGALAGVAALPGLSTVESLSLGAVATDITGSTATPHVPIPRDDIVALAASPNLKALRSLTFCDALSDRGAEALGTAPWLNQIEELTIQGGTRARGGITGEGLSSILVGELPRLRNLGLFQMSLRERGARALAAATLPALERLTLCQVSLADAAAHLFGSRVLAPVDYLHISDDDLREAIAALGRAGHTGSLRVLELPRCHLDDRAAATLASCEGFPKLGVLRLHYNELGRDGAAALATGMPELTELYLADNPFRTGDREYVEFPEDSDGVSGWYDVRVPRDELLALFAHRPGLRVTL